MGVRIFTHGDGICAGAIALAANPDAHVFFTHPFGLIEDLNVAEDQDTVIVVMLLYLKVTYPSF